MSGDDEKPKRKKVGYGSPPVEHQFLKGVSGNSKGRPRKPKRLFAPRQVRRDILAITEAPVTLQTPEGEIVVPTFVAVLMVARKKALSGHGPSIRLLQRLGFELFSRGVPSPKGYFAAYSWRIGLRKHPWNDA